MTAAALPRRTFGVQTAIGLALATAVIGAWLALHIYGVFFHRWTAWGVALAPVLVALQCWLNVGLFIVAHDCMHGSLAPFRPAVNRWLGRLCLFLYAGFSYDRLIAKHFDHHRHAGTALDPDFDAENPAHFWRWYVGFIRRYLDWKPLAIMTVVATLYQFVLGAGTANVILLWAVPAILSSVQLFFFGTYLPHRHEEDGFTDRHNSRSSDFPWLVSLLTCFHFGYHHEHHELPHEPWWRLPQARAGRT